MPVISINVADVESLRAAMQQRVGDLSVARDRIRHVRQTLAVNRDDPAVRSLPDVLAAIEGRLAVAAADLDRERAAVTHFVAAVKALDATGHGRSVGDQLRSQLAGLGSQAHLSWSDLSKMMALTTRRAFDAGRSVAHVGFDVLRRSGGVVLSGAAATGRSLGKAFDRYVGSPLGHFFGWVADRWRRVSDAFGVAWAQAWAKFQTLLDGLRRAAQFTIQTATTAATVVRVGVRSLQLLVSELDLVWRTEFKKVDQRPGAEVTIEQSFEGTVELAIPLDEFGIPLNLTPSVKVAAKVKHFDDGTVEITLGEEVGLGLSRAIESSGLDPRMKAKLKVAVEAALGGEQTYRIADTMIDGRPAYQVFIEQQVTRGFLQTLAGSGISATAAAAAVALSLMAPAPDPVKSSVYLSAGAEVSLDMSVGDSGVKAELKQKLTAKYSVTDAGKAEIEVEAELEAKAAAALFHVGLGGDVKVTATFRVVLDEAGRPEAIVVEGMSDTRASAGGDTDRARGLAGAGELTTVRRTLNITPQLTSRVGDLVQGLPGSADELIHLLVFDPHSGVNEVERQRYTFARVETELGAHASTGAGAEAKVDVEQRVYESDAPTAPPDQGGW